MEEKDLCQFARKRLAYLGCQLNFK
jgi:hypothetical protein